MTRHERPLTGPAPCEIPLVDPPLIRVLAQLRYPSIISVDRREFVAPFQEAIRREYPVLRPNQFRELSFGPEGIGEGSTHTAWHFHDATDTWRVVLTSEALSIETQRYVSRDDFLDRFGRVVQALQEHVQPAIIDRLGVRYVDRLVGEDALRVPEWVRPEVSGVLGLDLGGSPVQAVSHNIFELPDEQARLMVRWGMLPPMATVDPRVIEPLDQKSWILDLDAFREEQRPFEAPAILREAEAFSRRIYSVFRWAVTDGFLRHFGGDV